MNVVERDAARAAEKAVEQPPPMAPSEPAQSRKLRPLLSLIPYVARYRWQASAAR
jgi:hypothetical protein